jgi:cell division septation protein DedD
MLYTIILHVKKNCYMNFLATLLATVLFQPSAVVECGAQSVPGMTDIGILPMLIYFNSNDCNTCVQFDELFDEPETLRRIEEHYVVVRMNIHEADGRACAKIYHVESPPAMVVANHNGAVLYKSDETLSLEDIGLLLNGLPGKITEAESATEDDLTEEYIVRPVSTIQTGETEIHNDMIMPATTINPADEIASAQNIVPLPDVEAKPADIHKFVTPDPASNEIAVEHVASLQSQGNHDNQAVNIKETVSSFMPKKYAIQLGYFSEMQNANEFYRQVKLKDVKDLRTVEEQRSGNTFYRILAGACPTLGDAQSLLAQINDLGFKGVVYRQ